MKAGRDDLHGPFDPPSSGARGTVLLATQAYVPDSAAAGQYLADAAAALAERGWHVRVLTSQRGYNDPRQRYRPREGNEGPVRIRRVWGPASSGKRHLGERLPAMIVFAVQAAAHALCTPGLSGILVSTSPPILPLLMMAVAKLRGLPLVYWVMDLNPDQAIESGKVSPDAWSARMLTAAQRWVFMQAAAVLVLDRFMEARVKRHLASEAASLSICPLWPLAGRPAAPPETRQQFRQRHRLDGYFVVMYSGNHSLVHPLDTVVDAARRLRDDDRFRFVFIGSGEARTAVEAAKRQDQLDHVILLPSQPFGTLGGVLAAADVHLVSMGNRMVGCVHPSKTYGVLAAGRPLVLFGPSPSPVADLLERHDCGWRFPHGEVEGFVQLLRSLVSPEGQVDLARKRDAASRALASDDGTPEARARWVDNVEDALRTNRG